MKPYLVELNIENQSAFVAHGQIQDNIIVAQEFFEYLKVKNKGKSNIWLSNY